MGLVFSSMAASLDGYIASTSGDLAWLNDAMAPGEDYGFAATEQRTGAYVMGTNTFREHGGSAGGGVPTWVVTHRHDLKPTGKHVRFFAGDLRELVRQVKAETDKDIYVFGGGSLLTQFVELDLLDELELAIVPVLLGDGVRLFGRLSAWRRLRLVQGKPFPSGIVLLTYRPVR